MHGERGRLAVALSSMKFISIFLFFLSFFLFTNTVFADVGVYSVSSNCIISIVPPEDLSATMPHVSNSTYFYTPTQTSGVSGWASTYRQYYQSLGFSTSSLPISTDMKTVGGAGFHAGSGSLVSFVDGATTTYPFVATSDTTCTPITNLDSFYSGSDFSQSYNTRFVGVTSIALATSTNTISFDVSQFIDISELVASSSPYNISHHYVSYQSGTSSSSLGELGFSFSPTDGYSTTSLSVQSSNFSNDGTYSFMVHFGNLNTVFTDLYAFSQTYLLFDVVISGGIITSTHVDTAYTPQSFLNDYSYQDCSLSAFSGCISNAVIFLIVPSDFSVETIQEQFSILLTKKPFSYFSQVTDVIQTAAGTTATTTFVNLEITFTDGALQGTYPIITKASLDAIYPDSTRLLVKTAIANGLWVLFTLTLLFMILNIFNRSTYRGESGGGGSDDSLATFHYEGVPPNRYKGGRTTY